MGGFGAQNRRRLQRQEPDAEVNAHKHDKSKRPFTTRPAVKTHPKKKLTEKKFKKPKYLKRKLESLAVENQQEKDVLLQTLQESERRKQLKEIGTSSPSKIGNHQNANKSPERSRKKEELQALQKARKSESASKSTETDLVLPEAGQGEERQPKKSKKLVDVRNEGTKQGNEKLMLARPGERSYGKQESDSDDNEATLPRQRGKRRRGRKDTSTNAEVTKSVSMDDKETADVKVLVADGTKHGERTEKNITKKAKETGDRYCIGRKPVTDFQVGKSYPATVVYAKSFGVFFDIGCHADAFCHVSRLSDGFVEAPETLFPPGRAVDAARVVEVDRQRKRITISLQSEAKLQDERSSLEARKERRQKHYHDDNNQTPRQAVLKEDSESPKLRSQSPNAPPEQERVIAPQSSICRDDDVVKSKPESDMGPAELKRARKQARRAARRAEKEDPQKVQQ